MNEIQTIIGKEFPQIVVPLIDSAKKSIKVVVFDWRWYPQDPANPVQIFNQAFVRAARRGVEIEAIANNDEIVRTLLDQGIKAKRVMLKTIIHSKLIIIDNKIVVIGSHNYTQSAFTFNQEISVVISDCSDIDKFNLFFHNLYL